MLSKIFVDVIRKLPISWGIRFCNFAAVMRKSGVRFSIQGHLLKASTSEYTHFVGTPKRGLMFLTNGLGNRGQQLRKQYLLEYVEGPIRKVIDVGANSGDFILALPSTVVEYLGVEPIEEEFQALQRNC